MTSKREKILAALQAGEELTAKQMKQRFGVGDAVREVNRLRHEGYAIYLNTPIRLLAESQRSFVWAPHTSSGSAGYQKKPCPLPNLAVE